MEPKFGPFQVSVSITRSGLGRCYRQFLEVVLFNERGGYIVPGELRDVLLAKRGSRGPQLTLWVELCKQHRRLLCFRDGGIIAHVFQLLEDRCILVNIY